jgi:AcrR family transcriptional regulator
MTANGLDTRERLLRCARDLYLEEGPSRLSLREVARRAGVSAPAVYRHFDGKGALLGAVCSEGFRLFGSYLMRALREGTPMARLRKSGLLYLHFALENPRDYRVIFMTALDEPGPAKGAADAPPTFQFIVDRARECMDSGDLARHDPTEVAAVIWAHVHGLVSLRLSGHMAPVGDDAAFEDFYMRSTDALLAGLGHSR